MKDRRGVNGWINNCFTLILISLIIGNVDYQSFDKTFVIPAGQSSYIYMATILSNPEHEPTEWFSAAIQYVSGSELLFMGRNASVAIMDTDGKNCNNFYLII